MIARLRTRLEQLERDHPRAYPLAFVLVLDAILFAALMIARPFL
jgi:hypothetical protein